MILAVRLFVLCLFALLTSTVPSGGQGVPTPPGFVPSNETRACLVGPRLIASWQETLRMQEWRVVYSCEREAALLVDPEGNRRRGLSRTDSETKTLYIWVNPDEANPEEVIPHEMAHGLLFYTAHANSKVVHENSARVLGEILYEFYNLRAKCKPCKQK